MKSFFRFLVTIFLTQGVMMADTNNVAQEKDFKKIPLSFFVFTPQTNGYHRIAIVLDYKKVKDIMEKEGKNNDYIKEKLRGSVTIYKQTKRENRPKLIEKIDIQDFKLGHGGYYATLSGASSLGRVFLVENINEKYFDREYYSFYIDLESSEDLGDVGFIIFKEPRPPVF